VTADAQASDNGKLGTADTRMSTAAEQKNFRYGVISQAAFDSPVECSRSRFGKEIMLSFVAM